MQTIIITLGTIGLLTLNLYLPYWFMKREINKEAKELKLT